jgi:hypothetical protein
MSGIADIALGAAPIAGGALLGVVANSVKGPDIRGNIKADLELLEKIPADQVELRAALEKSIYQRISDLVESAEKSRQLREIATSYAGNWRDIVVFLCAVLFTIVWWNVPHERTNWLLMFIFLVVLCGIVAIYASRGVIRAVRNLRSRQARTNA